MNPPPTQPLLLPLSRRLAEWLREQPDVRGVEEMTDWDSFYIGLEVNTEDGWHEYFLIADGPDQPTYTTKEAPHDGNS